METIGPRSVSKAVFTSAAQLVLKVAVRDEKGRADASCKFEGLYGSISNAQGDAANFNINFQM